MINWGYTVAIVITGLVVVFVLLYLLVLVCMLLGKIFSSVDPDKKTKDKALKDEQKEKEKASTPVVQDKAEDEGVVAAITAAIAAIFSSEGNHKPFAIKSIKRSKESRPAWGNAGIIENTRQF